MKGAYQTHFRPGTTQNVAYSATAGAIATAVGSYTRAVRVMTTTAAFVAIGTTPTATTSDMPTVANEAIIIQIQPGEKVSAVQSAAAGTLYVTELTNG